MAVTLSPARKARARLRTAVSRKPRTKCPSDTRLDHAHAPQQEGDRAGEVDKCDRDLHDAFNLQCNPVSIAAGINDSLGNARTYLQHEVATLTLSRVDAYLENAPRMIDFFQRETDVAFTASLHGDRQPENPGGLVSGRSLSPAPYDGMKLGSWFNDLAPPPRETMLFGMQIGYGSESVDFLNAARSITAAVRVAGHFIRYGATLARYGRNTRLDNGNALIARLAQTSQRLRIPL